MSTAFTGTQVAPALSVRDLVKTYPGVRALDNVSVAFEAGRVHALMGENGAGKSTLVKAITGAISPDSGEIAVGGHVRAALTPREARSLGVSALHQERQVAPDLSVGENILLGRMPVGRLGRVDRARARRLATEALERVGLELEPDAPVAGLGVAQLQALEIARAISAKATVVVLDEPTSAIGGEDVLRLFELVRRLRDEGVAVIYISHHLEEVFELADVVTTLRDGQLVSTRPIAELTPAALLREMLGQDPPVPLGLAGPSAAAGGAIVLRASGLACGTALSGVDVDVRSGEVLCVAGGLGSGRRELARCLAGAERPTAGTVELDGHELRSPGDAVRRGVVFLPQDRKREALMLDLTLGDNVAVGALACSRAPFSVPARRTAMAATAVRDLAIKAPSVRTVARALSGGNQQKVVLGRWLQTGARVYIFDEPTAGIDVNAKLEIHRLLRRLAARGAAVVVFSSDFDEIEAVADRAIVLRRGAIVGELARPTLGKEAIMAMSLGVAA